MSNMTPDDAPPFEIPDPYVTLRLVAKDEINKALIQHLALCPFSKDQVPNRLRQMELKFATLVGFMVGSGIIGGTVGALLGKLLPN